MNIQNLPSNSSISGFASSFAQNSYASSASVLHSSGLPNTPSASFASESLSARSVPSISSSSNISSFEEYKDTPSFAVSGSSSNGRESSSLSDGSNISSDEEGAAESPKDDAQKRAESAQEQQQLAQEQEEISALAARDREVRTHEQAHAAVGGPYAGAPSYDYERGPDGVRYAVGGEVPIDVSQAATPAETIQKMQVVRRAALAPAEPSPQDRRVAAQAAGIEAEARNELAKETLELTKEQSASDGSIRSREGDDKRFGRGEPPVGLRDANEAYMAVSGVGKASQPGDVLSQLA